MSDYIKSDYCLECGGCGFISGVTELFDDHQIETEQCEECERLHELEKKADRLEDEIMER